MSLKNVIGRLPGSSKYARNISANFWYSHGASAFCRENEEDILNGKIPNRYARIAPFVKGQSVVEIGCGEGLLTLAMREKARVLGVDVSSKRVDIARNVQKKVYPSSLGSVSFKCENAVDFIVSRAFDYESIVFNRSFYHFSSEIPKLLNALAANKIITEIILVGNHDKRELLPEDHDLGKWIKYSKVAGMVDALQSIGFSYEIIDDQLSDPIVRGVRSNFAGLKISQEY